MDYLWPETWFIITPKNNLALKSIATTWNKKGLETLKENDWVRMEPFLQFADAIYNEDEVVILSRLGQNGVQEQFCTMTLKNNEWILNWFLHPEDPRRTYLTQIGLILYGEQNGNNKTHCMVLLTHCISILRKMKISRKGDHLVGEFIEPKDDEVIYENSVEALVSNEEEN